MKPTDPMATVVERHNDPFGSTRWSVVLAAGVNDGAGRSALETLCKTYWQPVRGFVWQRTSGDDVADDLTQEFFRQLLERKSISAADPARGRFRAFLLTALKNFLANEHERASAVKRGGGRVIQSLDAIDADGRPVDVPDLSVPDREFDRQWALALLEKVLGRLEKEQKDAGRAAVFIELREFLTGQNGELTYADVAPRLKLTEEAARAAVSRLRKRYQAILREEISQTVATGDEVEDELRRLFAAVGS